MVQNSYLFNLLFIYIFNLVSQDHVKMSGRVTDTNGEPVPLANIYVDNSSIGTTADLDGYYELDRVPLGLQRIVIQQINYEKQIVKFNLNQPQHIIRNFKLKSILNESEEVVVEVDRDDEFTILYNRFIKEFIGYSDFAENVEILNREYLELKWGKMGGYEGRSLQPIHIINHALGYEMFYDIDSVESYEGKFAITGDVKFKQLAPENAKFNMTEEKWIKNRRYAFKYSLRYFFRELYHNRTKSKNIYYSKVNNFPSFEPYPSYFVKFTDIISPSLNNFKRLTLDQSVLEVVQMTLVPNDYRRHFRKTLMFDKNRIKSFLKVYGWVDFNENRSYIPSGGYKGYEIQGYFTFHRVAGMLPEDYDPDSNSISKSD